jgi:TPR repeat protein
MHQRGYGTETQLISAIQWYRKATEENQSSASFNLGNSYYDG